MKANSNFLAYAICFSVLIQMSLTENVCTTSEVEDMLSRLREQVCTNWTQSLEGNNRKGKEKDSIENFAGKLRSFVSRTSFDHLTFMSQIDELDDNFHDLKENMDLIILPKTILNRFKFTKTMFLVMKGAVYRQNRFQKSSQSCNALLYRVFEVEVILFRLQNSTGKLDVLFDGYLREILGSIISLNTLERDFKSCVGPTSFSDSRFKPQARKVREILQALLLQVPKSEFQP